MLIANNLNKCILLLFSLRSACECECGGGGIQIKRHVIIMTPAVFNEDLTNGVKRGLLLITNSSNYRNKGLSNGMKLHDSKARTDGGQLNTFPV